MIYANERGRISVKTDRIETKINAIINILKEEPGATLTTEQVIVILQQLMKIIKKELTYWNTKSSKEYKTNIL